MLDEEEAFEKGYEETLETLKQRSLGSDFSIEAVESELASLYVFEGQDWHGRGILFHRGLEGSIAAYTIFIKDYKKRALDN